MSVLLGVMVFSMDAGYLYYKKNALQNRVEAVALAGAQHLCDEDLEEITRYIAAENGLPNLYRQLEITTGFYDARGEFSLDLGDYQDFGPPPSGRFINAVHVRLTQTVSSLTGMNPSVALVSEAVAYIRRVDIVSLDPEGYIHLGHDSIWESTVFSSNNRLEYPHSTTFEGRQKTSPELNDCEVFVADGVYSCPVTVNPWGYTGHEVMTVNWGSGNAQTSDNIFSGVDPVTEIRPVDDTTFNYWYEQADIIYTPDQAGQDDVFYGKGTLSSGGGQFYYIDPAREPGSGRQVIFFDAGTGGDGTVLLGPYNSTSVAHTPNGFTIADLTFVSTCPVQIINHGNITSGSPVLHIGGEGEAQAIIISGSDIEVIPGGAAECVFDGVVFRTGGDFIMDEKSNVDTLHKIRIIADGSIYGEPYSLYRNDPGLFNFSNNAQFGPPCMTGMARLGRLERSQRE